MKDLLIRSVIALIVIAIPFLERTDIDSLLYIFPVAYIFSAYFLRDLSKYILILADIIFFLFVIYLTSNPILSIFFYPIFISYLEDKKHLIAFLFAGLVVSFYGFYTSEYIEFSILLFWLPATVSILLAIQFINRLQNLITRKDEEISQKLNQVASLKEKIYPIKIEELSKISLNDKKKAIFLFNQLLNTSAVAYFDLESQKCIYTQENICNKEILKYIDNDFGKIETEEGIVIFIVEHKDKNPVGIFFFFYENPKLEDSIYNFLYLREKLNN